jgi:hypothetical protein
LLDSNEDAASHFGRFSGAGGGLVTWKPFGRLDKKKGIGKSFDKFSITEGVIQASKSWESLDP